MKIFITGASSGIGSAFARHYAARGFALGLQGRREAVLRELAVSLGVPCAVHACDVRDARATQAAAAVVARGVQQVVICASETAVRGKSSRRQLRAPMYTHAVHMVRASTL